MERMTMTKKLTTFDPAELLQDDEAIAIYMEGVFETGDANYIAHALGVVARARGMTQLASETGLAREQLYRSFSKDGNPTLKTTLAVMKALGLELTAKPHAPKSKLAPRKRATRTEPPKQEARTAR
jgi:probable addiction module antidote protein